MIFTLFAAKLKQKWAKENKKKNLDTKAGPYHKRHRSTILKWIRNTHSDNFTINTKPLTLTKD